MGAGLIVGDLVRYVFTDSFYKERGIGVVLEVKITPELTLADIILGNSSFDHWKGNEDIHVRVFWSSLRTTEWLQRKDVVPLTDLANKNGPQTPSE